MRRKVRKRAATEPQVGASSSSGDSPSNVPNGCTGCGRVIPKPGWCSEECMNQDTADHLTRDERKKKDAK